MAKVNINNNGQIEEKELTSINYTSLLRTTAAHGKLALTDQIYDNVQMKTQEEINENLIEITDELSQGNVNSIYVFQNDWAAIQNSTNATTIKNYFGITAQEFLDLFLNNGTVKRIFVKMGNSTGIVYATRSDSSTTLTINIVVYYNGGYCRGYVVVVTTPGSQPCSYVSITVGSEERSQAITSYLSVADALIYKGTIAGAATSNTNKYGNLTPSANKGWYYKVSANGFINGVAVKSGDVLICNTDDTKSATSSNYTTIVTKWDYIQSNVDIVTDTTDGLMSYEMLAMLNSSVASVTGKINNDNNGYTITVKDNKEIPKSFTIPIATEEKPGLLSFADKKKLNNLSNDFSGITGKIDKIESDLITEIDEVKNDIANNYSTKSETLKDLDFNVNSTTDKVNLILEGQFANNTPFNSSAASVPINAATETLAGVMTSTDKTKLNKHESALTWQ